jgi:hypothetical protein
MQRKKRIPKTLGYVTVLSITMLFLFVGYDGPKNLSAEESMPFRSLVVGWGELNKQSPTLPDGGKIVTITFVSDKGGIFISDARGIERKPCGKITETGSAIGTKCISLTQVGEVVGLGQKAILYTKGSPYCVAETFGGYVIEYNPLTGEQPCR